MATSASLRLYTADTPNGPPDKEHILPHRESGARMLDTAIGIVSR